MAAGAGALRAERVLHGACLPEPKPGASESAGRSRSCGPRTGAGAPAPAGGWARGREGARGRRARPAEEGRAPSPFCWNGIKKGVSPAPPSSACAHLLRGPPRSERTRTALTAPQTAAGRTTAGAPGAGRAAPRAPRVSPGHRHALRRPPRAREPAEGRDSVATPATATDSHRDGRRCAGHRVPAPGPLGPLRQRAASRRLPRDFIPPSGG